mmetsp:Transcript_14992/g.44908  ORF Transcript_14992/g.44908 Transcript_14992/m.44908 type:complete len:595 (-) Transcript_14992:305-2089(-)
MVDSPSTRSARPALQTEPGSIHPHPVRCRTGRMGSSGQRERTSHTASERHMDCDGAGAASEREGSDGATSRTPSSATGAAQSPDPLGDRFPSPILHGEQRPLQEQTTQPDCRAASGAAVTGTTPPRATHPDGGDATSRLSQSQGGGLARLGAAPECVRQTDTARRASDRLVRDENEHQAREIREPPPRPERRGRRVQHRGLDGRLRLSAAPASSSRASRVGGAQPAPHDDSGTRVAGTALVETAAGRSTGSTTTTTGIGVQTRRAHVTNQLCMEILSVLPLSREEALTIAKLHVDAVAATTVKTYWAIFTQYRRWTEQRRVEVFAPEEPATWIADRVVNQGHVSAQQMWAALQWVFEAVRKPLNTELARRTRGYAARRNTRQARTNLVQVDDILSFFSANPDWATTWERRRTKAIILLSISLLARGADLHTLDWIDSGDPTRGLVTVEDGIYYVTFERRKQHRGARQRTRSHAVEFAEDPHSCAARALRDWLQSRTDAVPALFVGRNGGSIRPLTADSINRIRKTFLQNDMELQGATSHQLKSAAVSWMRERGASLDRTMRRMDATSEDVLRRYYDRSSDGGDPIARITNLDHD